MRPLSVSDLLDAWDEGQALTPSERALLLLEAACAGKNRDEIAGWSAGQRDGMLLTLREYLFGTPIKSVTSCPACGERLELDFTTQDIRATAPDVPPLGLIPPNPLNSKFLTGPAKLNPIEAVLAGLVEASKSADAVTGTGNLNVLRYGRLLKARSLVGVRGVGIAYDGLYYVKSVTSHIKRGEFKQISVFPATVSFRSRLVYPPEILNRL